MQSKKKFVLILYMITLLENKAQSHLVNNRHTRNYLIYTSELILCSHICVYSATRHNIHMYPYFLFAAIHHLNRPRLSLSDLVAQSAE